MCQPAGIASVAGETEARRTRRKSSTKYVSVTDTTASCLTVVPVSCFLHPRQIRRGQDQALQLTHQPTRHQRGNRSPRSTARLSSRGQTRSRQKANPLSTRCARSRAKRADPSNGQRRGNRRGVLRGLDHCVRLRQPLELLSR